MELQIKQHPHRQNTSQFDAVNAPLFNDLSAVQDGSVTFEVSRVQFLPRFGDSFDKLIRLSGFLNLPLQFRVLFSLRVMLSLANSISASATASRSLLSMSSISTTTSTIITKTKTTGASGEGRN